jgi:hypothetical protein
MNNAVPESQLKYFYTISFNDAGYYYWRLAQENLRLIANADKDKPAPGDRDKVVRMFS